MPNDTIADPTLFEFAAHETLVSSLRNAHAMEKQQIQVLDSHLELFVDCPELHARVTQHLIETREQARRLEATLEACGGSASILKDAMMSVMGFGQSSVQSFGADAGLKAVTAAVTHEHLEIATYRMLIQLAGLAGMAELRLRLMETLREEESMAVWFDENLEAITKRFIEIKARDQLAGLVPKDDAAAQAVSPTSDSEQSKTLWQQLEKPEQSSAHPRSKAEKPDTSPSTPSRAVTTQQNRSDD